jgi:hypothetical protein
MTLLFFLIGCASAWHGFSTGGPAGFYYMVGGVVLWIFALAASTMNTQPRFASHRPPTHAPGWKKGRML